MSERTWVIICGQVRSLFELSYTIHEAIRAKREGIVEGIILSTWRNERQKAPWLLDMAEREGVLVIESSLPKAWKDRIDASALYQMLQVQRALEFVPDGAYVLKTRTDLLVEQFVHLLLILRGSHRGVSRSDILDPGRLSCFYASNVLFFDVCDTHYFGAKENMRSTIEFGVYLDAASTSYVGHFVPEQRILGQKYIRQSPNVSFLCNAIEVLKYRLFPAAWGATGRRAFPRLIVKAYAEYFASLLRHFQLLGDQPPKKIRDFRFGDLFEEFGLLGEGIYRPGCAAIRSQSKLQLLYTIEPDSTDKDAVLFREFLDAHFAKNPQVGPVESDDLEELILFNESLPQEIQFLATTAEELRCRVPRKRPSAPFDFGQIIVGCVSPDEQDGAHRFAAHIQDGDSISAAAWKVSLLNNNPSKLWLRLSAYYGNSQAREILGLKNLNFAELRKQCDEFLNTEFFIQRPVDG